MHFFPLSALVFVAFSGCAERVSLLSLFSELLGGYCSVEYVKDFYLASYVSSKKEGKKSMTKSRYIHTLTKHFIGKTCAI